MKNSILKIIYWFLKKYAQKVLRRHKPFVVAVTGSVGKTTTKEFIYQIFCDNFGKENVRANTGNLNAEVGIPLTILGYTKVPGKLELIWIAKTAWVKTYVKKYPKYLILEMGVEHPGDIDYFCSIVKPDVGVITAATPAHVVNFKNLNEMQSEKLKLLKYVNKAVINGDDEFISKNKTDALKYSVRDNQADCFATDVEISVSGTKYKLHYKGKEYLIKNSLLGKQMISSQLAAFLASKASGIEQDEAVESLDKLKPYPGRMSLLHGEREITIIDDTYNANPASVKAAIETLFAIKTDGRKVLILGNMNEQGDEEVERHLEIGKYARGKVDLALFCGDNAKNMQKGYGDEKTSEVFHNRQELIGSIGNILKEKDLVLIKASQNRNYFEEVVKYLIVDKKQASRVLVRQSASWLIKKR